MASPKLLLCLSCILLIEAGLSWVHQDKRFLTVVVGDELTLRCFYKDAITRLYWFIQHVGKKPRCIHFDYPYTREVQNFKNQPRFKILTNETASHLKIMDVKLSDSATYFCASLYAFNVDISEGCAVFVTASGSVSSDMKVVASKALQPGDSETVDCSVQTGGCSTGHNAYWFRNSDGAHPGIIFSHGDATGHCETKTSTCLYSLQVHNLTQSIAGTYYCAVASCGRILFGNGTKLGFNDKKDWPRLILVGALAFTTIYSLVTTFLLCKMKKRSSSSHSDQEIRLSANSKSNQDEEDLNYAALMIHNTETSRRQRKTTTDEIIYSSVK